jgi:hypothetical protein
MHTEAAVLSAEGKAATLGQNGKQLTVQILTPEGAVFRVMDAAPLPTSPAPSQADNTGRRKLAIRLNGVTHLKLSVKLMPVQGGQDDS